MKKIIAVIPARGGSKGIPNKNLRLINNRPLIWYSISNALKSSMITEVIVSTDSPQIALIAKQMGVKVRKRNSKLCGDMVTLDSVVYDACKDEQCDYVVTLQPTSPTLKNITLDEAIEYCINKNLDTVISVVNSPHLSWRYDENKVIPNYKKRLNRQQLPDNFVETGAFLISKRNVMTSDTRIGRKVDIFEISDDEAVDIDTFKDLKCAEIILQNKKIAIYVNGNNKRGLGHVYRALELADEFNSKPDIFYDINQTDKKIFGMTTHKVIGVDGINELIEICKAKQYDIFINDILSTSIDYMIAVRRALPNSKIINFEDDGEGVCKADLVINALYNTSNRENIKTGDKYYIAPKNFLLYKKINIKESVTKVFISFGGSDPQNYSDRLLKIISKEKYKDFNFVVILGRAKKNIQQLLKYNEFENIDVKYDIANIAQYMFESDVGITSRGRTAYELAILGVPTIAIAQNEREETHEFINEEHGFSYLGLNPCDMNIENEIDLYIAMSKENRMRCQNLLMKNQLKNGRNRVKALIESL